MQDDEDDGCVEMPDIEEIEEAVSTTKQRRSPVRRTPFKSRKMMGNTRYRGSDKIRPASWCFTVFTAFMIFVPSLPCLTVV